MRYDLRRDGEVFVGVPLLEVIDVVALGLVLLALERSQILPQVDIVEIIPFGDIEESIGMGRFEQRTVFRRDAQHAERMAIGKRILF